VRKNILVFMVLFIIGIFPNFCTADNIQYESAFELYENASPKPEYHPKARVVISTSNNRVLYDTHCLNPKVSEWVEWYYSMEGLRELFPYSDSMEEFHNYRIIDRYENGDLRNHIVLSFEGYFIIKFEDTNEVVIIDIGEDTVQAIKDL